MDSKGREAINEQQTLAPIYAKMMAEMRDAKPEWAYLVSAYIKALRTECASRRVETKELSDAYLKLAAESLVK